MKNAGKRKVRSADIPVRSNSKKTSRHALFDCSYPPEKKTHSARNHLCCGQDCPHSLSNGCSAPEDSCATFLFHFEFQTVSPYFRMPRQRAAISLTNLFRGILLLTLMLLFPGFSARAEILWSNP